MFRLPKDTEITLPLLQEMLQAHSAELHRLRKLEAAYKGNHDILHAQPKPNYKPDNRIVVNFPKYIVDTFNGFFIGNPIKVVAKDSAVAEYIEYLDGYNDQDSSNAEIAKIMSIYGKCYEMYFTDEDAEICTVHLSPLDAFMVKDDSILERPLFFVRRYTDRENNEFGSISNAYGVRYFAVTGGLRWLDEDWQPHYFPGVPATEFVENEEELGIFEPALSMINAYNKAVSEKANDVDYFADAYLKILGASLNDDELQHIRDNRIINFDNGDIDRLIVEFMDKPASDATQEHLLDVLKENIFITCMVANISDENFGTASGIALQYKVLAMHNLFQNKKRKFTSGLNRRYKLIFGHPASKIPADSWVQLSFTFTPNLPANLQEEAQVATQLEGIVSRHTQLKTLSNVEDVEAELEQIATEEEEAAEKTAARMESVLYSGLTAEPETPEVMSDEQ